MLGNVSALWWCFIVFCSLYGTGISLLDRRNDVLCSTIGKGCAMPRIYFIYPRAFMYFESQFAIYVGSTHFNYELELITSIVCILTDFLFISLFFAACLHSFLFLGVSVVRSPQISPPDEIRSSAESK